MDNKSVKQSRKTKVQERYIGSEIIFKPKMRQLKLGQTIVDVQGRTGKVTDFDPTFKQMFNRAQGYHAVCVRFDGDSYDDCLHWSEVFCLVNEKPEVKNHDENDDECDCFKCLENDYNNPNGSYFLEANENSVVSGI